MNILGNGNVKLKIDDAELEKKLLIKTPNNKHIYKIQSETGSQVLGLMTKSFKIE